MSESRVDRRAFISTVSSGIAAAVVGGGLDAMASPSPATKQRQSGTTGLVDDERYREHLISSSHPESPERLRTIGSYLEQTGLTALLTPLSGEVAAQEHILALHSQSHYASVMACPTTGDIAQLAVSQVLGAADAIAQGHVRNPF